LRKKLREIQPHFEGIILKIQRKTSKIKNLAMPIMVIARTFTIEGRTVVLNKNEQVACNRCHKKP
jgi:hypothetical protein